MPEVNITIGGRDFTVACQEGEERFLHAAAQMLDREASTLVDQLGRVPETRMLLMAGLMLADRTAALEDRAKAAEDSLARQERLIEEMRTAPAPEPRRVEVPVVPESVTQLLSEMAARAESAADLLEKKAG
ncbi:cell division protein ZapA [Roseicyclus sp. F158]|uniref:Cell division protein ZapA n=1 Tax=Tropicimonas omnivorans TaxID=3075590 RepID=A0ABU3DJA9_9RHOB|nr:cell division protein ZapA [Roseicyclus sp. F158]MDT0683799.1 cell division protein ZapA [Roseicyclus sp. F158]